MTRPELAGTNPTANGVPRRSLPEPFDASPAPRDAASVVGIAMPDPPALVRMSKSKVVEVLYLFGDAVDRLLQRLNHVEGILAKNSRNSSKPPSSDQPARKPKPAPTLNAAVKRKPGGQPGHEGHALRRVPIPDEVVVHGIAHACECGLPLAPLLQESRQVFDLPRPAMRVVEHQIFSATCNCAH